MVVSFQGMEKMAPMQYAISQRLTAAPGTSAS